MNDKKKQDGPESTLCENKADLDNPFAVHEDDSDPFEVKSDSHYYGKKNNLCSTDTRGYATPRNLNPTELVLHASEGFIPLWAEGVNLRWRFNEASLSMFQSPAAAKREFKRLMSEALFKWGDAAPVRFTESQDVWDFEVVIRTNENCNINGCTLASAFFPDPGRHELIVYPTMFQQSRKEQVDTLIHEIGHIFGLRHFFADISETQWPVERFGTHRRFSIMNYGADSELTDVDISDLRNLYRMVWSGELTHINGTPIVQVHPFHRLGHR